MKLFGILDRHLLWEWNKILLATAIGFPIFVIVIDITEKLDDYLAQGIPPGDIALSYVFSFPETLRLVLPAAVLFATAFTLGTFSRHLELNAVKACGRSFHRLVVPILLAAGAVTGIALFVGEVAPASTSKQMELLGERERRTDSNRFNFVYRADEGWVYIIASLDADQRLVRNLQMEREGTGGEYPTLVVQSPRAAYDDSLAQWNLSHGRFHIVTGTSAELAFEFDSVHVRSFREPPSALLSQPKRPEEMAYRELGSYIEALERSGGDGRRLRVSQELKISIPFTCLVIALFSAPLAVSAPRASGALGIGIGLGTTIVFLLMVQLSQGVGSSGLLPPLTAAWLPNIAFAVAGMWMMVKVRT